MGKSPDAFRTISEVARLLETPAHVLRFWESKFAQVKPVKRAGGRRYYRPDDIALLAGIKALLHDQGLTIRGVQKILREQGARHVASLGGPLVPGAWEGPALEAAAEGDEAWPDDEAADAGEAQDEAPEADAAEDEPVEAAHPSFLDAVIARVVEPDPAPETAGVDPGGADWAADDPADIEDEPLGVVVAWTGPVAGRSDGADGGATAARVLDLLVRADPGRLRQRAAEIAPLARRLAALRDLGAGASAHPLRPSLDSL